MAIAERVFEGYLVLDWRNGAMTIKRRKPKQTPQTIPIKVILKVTLPEVKEFVARGEIEVTQSKLKDIVFEDV